MREHAIYSKKIRENELQINTSLCSRTKTTFPGSLKTNLSAFKSEDIKLHVSFLLFLQLYKHSMSVKTQ